MELRFRLPSQPASVPVSSAEPVSMKNMPSPLVSTHINQIPRAFRSWFAVLSDVSFFSRLVLCFSVIAVAFAAIIHFLILTAQVVFFALGISAS